MCLITYLNETSTTTEEQTYYKVLAYDRHKKTHVSPYMSFPVVYGKEYEEKKLFHVEEDYYGLGAKKFLVHGGGFHLFTDYRDAARERDLLNSRHSGRFQYVVARAIVPAGTYYKDGYFNTYRSVAVKKVRYEKLKNKK